MKWVGGRDLGLGRLGVYKEMMVWRFWDTFKFPGLRDLGGVSQDPKDDVGTGGKVAARSGTR